MYPLIETIKIVDGIAVNLEWHQRRYESAVREYLKTDTVYNLANILSIPGSFSRGMIKARLLYGATGFKWQFEPYVFRKISSIKIVYDDHIEYNFKYSDRSSLERLFAQRDNCDDILIVKNGLIADSLYCNIIFFDGTNWITPDRPLLRGTCRERLLHHKKIQEKMITPDQIKSLKYFKLINAMRDFNDSEDIPVSEIKF